MNIHQRIQLNYGESYGLEIESEPGQGTCVTAKFPGAYIPAPDGGIR
jgi:two-component system sensor histidine kinase YesM